MSEVLAAEVTTNGELAGILAYCWGDYGLPPAKASFFHHSMIARHYFGGSFYPVGGPAQIARCAIPTIEANPSAYKLSHLRQLNRMGIFFRKRCARKFDEI